MYKRNPLSFAYIMFIYFGDSHISWVLINMCITFFFKRQKKMKGIYFGVKNGNQWSYKKKTLTL